MGAITDRLLGENKETKPIPKIPTKSKKSLDIPEISDIPSSDIGFWESLPVNLKTGLTIRPEEKLNIITKHFAGDPRLGSTKQDASGNPIINWKGKDYYINKPGISKTDISDLIAQTTTFLPASRIASTGKNILQRFATAIPTYFATNVGQQLGTKASGGTDNISLPFLSPEGMAKSGIPTAIGATSEALMPPIMKGVGRLVRAAIPQALKTAPKVSSTIEQGIPLTKGQKSQDLNLLQREEAVRQGAYGPSGSDVIKQFDESQLSAIKSKAQTMQPSRSGFESEVATDIGEKLQTSLQAAAKAARQKTRDAYETARELSVSNPALLNREGVLGLSSDILNIPKSMGIAKYELDSMPLLKGALDQVKKLNKLAKNERFKPQNFSQIESTRKALNRMLKDSDGSQKEGIRQIIGKIDDWTDDAIESGLLSGDKTTIEAIKNARGLARDYFKKFGKEKGDPAGSALEKILDTKQASPMQVINYLTGSGNIKAGAVQIQLAKRLKEIFGPNSNEIKLLKDALIMKAFTGKKLGEQDVTRGALVKKAREFLNGDGRALSMELFNTQERKNIKALFDVVAKTITPDAAQNPSKSAWTIMRLLIENRPFAMSMNPISMAGKAVNVLAGDIGPGGGLKDIGGKMTAKNLVSQTDDLFTNPLVTSGTVASLITSEQFTNEE